MFLPLTRTVLLVNGICRSARFIAHSLELVCVYERNIAALARHFRVIVPDMPGYGRFLSTKGLSRTDPFGDCAGAMLGLLDSLEIDRACVVGNSLGGACALRLALDRPQRVAGLVLMGPGGIDTTRGLPTAGLKCLLDYYSDAGPSKEKLSTFIRQYLVYDGARVPQSVIEGRFQASLDPEVVANPPLVRPKGLPKFRLIDFTRDPRRVQCRSHCQCCCVSGQDGAHRRALDRGQRPRHHCPAGGRAADGRVEAAGHRREPPRRQRHRGDERAAAVSARWLHAGPVPCRRRHHPNDVQGSEVRHPARHGGGRHPGLHADADLKAGYQSLADVLKAGKARPDDITIGSPTRGSVPHLTAEMMGQLQKTKFRQVSFSGTTQAILAVVKGDVPVYVDGIAPLVPLVRSGRLKALAVTSDTALPGLDGIPLAKDVAPGLIAKGWFAVFAPKGTPVAVLDEINRAVSSSLAQPASG